MLIILFSFLISPSYAQDLGLLRDLSKIDSRSTPFIDEEINKKKRKSRTYEHINKIVNFEEIISSDEELGVLRPGIFVYAIDNSKKFLLDKNVYIRFHRLPDEQGFKYLVNKNGDITLKVKTDDILSIAPETVMYEPPHQYTPAPKITTIHWDKKLNLNYEVGFGVSMMQSHFVKDLLNLDATPTGQLNQVGGSIMPKWNWPFKVGLGAYFHSAKFSVDGSNANFSSFSFGPIFKSPKLDLKFIQLRATAQIRYSPMGKMDVDVPAGSTTFDFNTTDVLIGVELPIKNRFGEFLIQTYYHQQWLSLRNQNEIVNLKSSTTPNSAIGVGIAQVF